MKGWSIIFFVACGLIVSPAFLFTQQASNSQTDTTPQKFALVIGNGAYHSLTPLANPVNDANDMAATLEGLGFTVDKILDGSLDQMDSAVIRLENRLSVSRNTYGFFFYAGHGVQSNGENYLIPVDASIPAESFLRSRSLSVQAMLDELNKAGNILNVVVLDACRDNPFGWGRGVNRGLALVDDQPADSIIVYATSAGQSAKDGSGHNGLFTSQLLPNLKTPGLEVSEIFRRTMGDVIRVSGNQQRPAVYNQFPGLAYFSQPPVQSSEPTPANQSAITQAPPPAAEPVAPTPEAPQIAQANVLPQSPPTQSQATQNQPVAQQEPARQSLPPEYIPLRNYFVNTKPLRFSFGFTGSFGWGFSSYKNNDKRDTWNSDSGEHTTDEYSGDDKYNDFTFADLVYLNLEIFRYAVFNASFSVAYSPLNSIIFGGTGGITDISLAVQYPFDLNTAISLYPLACLDYAMGILGDGYSRADLKDRDTLSLTIGGGADYYLSERLKLNMELSYYIFLYSKASNLYNDEYSNQGPKINFAMDYNINNHWKFNVGLSYYIRFSTLSYSDSQYSYPYTITYSDSSKRTIQGPEISASIRYVF